MLALPRCVPLTDVLDDGFDDGRGGLARPFGAPVHHRLPRHARGYAQALHAHVAKAAHVAGEVVHKMQRNARKPKGRMDKNETSQGILNYSSIHASNEECIPDRNPTTALYRMSHSQLTSRGACPEYQSQRRS